MIDYTDIDKNPEMSAFIFYPRKGIDACPPYASDSLIKVDDNVVISCRLYSENPPNPWILYFHGNGEIASDYDEIAPFYLKKNLNLVVADYRGYGASSGTPSLMTLQKDCHPIFLAISKELYQRGYTRKPWLMGRSLGSLSVIELAFSHPDEIKGIILESGFTSVVSVFKHLFLPFLSDKGYLEHIEREALEQVGRIFLPTLVIHGDEDTLVPLHEAHRLYENMGSVHKRLLIIPNADHNTIMFANPDLYFGTISEFIRDTEFE